MPRAVEEILYPAMEDFKLDVVIGKGPSRAEHPAGPSAVHAGGRHDAPGLITLPLRERFGFSPRLDYYSAEDLARIVAALGRASWPSRSTRPAPSEIARRSRGTPRIANRLLRRVRDYAQVRMDGRITLASAEAALALFEVDERGLDKLDLAILSTLVEKFEGAPVGLSTLAAAVGEETDTVEDVYEPYLCSSGS